MLFFLQLHSLRVSADDVQLLFLCYAVGTLVNERNTKGLTGKLNWDGSIRYAVKALIEAERSGPGKLYTPTLVISRPDGKDINVGGTIKYAAWKVLDVNLALKGVIKTPITLKGELSSISEIY